MGPRRPTGHADIADHLALADTGAHGDAAGEARQVGVERRELGGMANFYCQPILKISVLMIDYAVGCRKNRLTDVRLVINAIVKAASR